MNIDQLYQKVAEFEQNLSSNFKDKLECKKGCQQCCYVDLSVFEIEAKNIAAYLNENQSPIKEKLSLKQADREDFNGVLSKPCHFLREDECTIYDVRPLICRTQGLAMNVPDPKEEYLDICPLNEKALDQIKSNEILNLETVNTLLIQLNRLEGGDDTRISLKKIAEKSLDY